MASTIPISKTNIVLLIDREADWGVANGSPAAKQLAYDTAAIVRQQALDPNVELRGSRLVGALVPGQKNPGGQIKAHQTDVTSVLWMEAMFGARSTSEIGGANCAVSAALAGVGAGLVTTGTHSYKITVTKGALGYTLPSSKSGTVTTDTSTNGKVNVSRTGGTMPTGWTWSIYRTAAGNATTGPWDLVVAGLAASVTTYLDNIADGSLGAAAPSASTYGDFSHVITVANALPSYTLERQHPYQDTTHDYVVALGAVCDTGNIAMKATGFDDFDGNFLARGVSTEAATVIGASSTDWRYGEKLHDAMIGAGKVKLGVAGGALSSFVGYVVDMKYAHNNNLDKTDFPMGLQGDRGSAIPMQATGTLTGNLKVSDKSILPLLQDYSVLYGISVEFDFATFGHSKLMEFLACQFDPTDAPVSGQGILTVPFTAHVVQDPNTGLMVRATIVNNEPTTSYDAP
jgi:hypothetical protein